MRRDRWLGSATSRLEHAADDTSATGRRLIGIEASGAPGSLCRLPVLAQRPFTVPGWRSTDAGLGSVARCGRFPAEGHSPRAHALASRLRAEPIVVEVQDLARVARIRLDAVTPAPVSPAGPGSKNRPWGITPREREILEHIVAGRTYGEIARTLFLSEKTVSSHVSNLLRKSGAANRVELARLAQHRGDAQP